MEFYAPGKIMLTGEYAVLKGATALALPTQKGQQMSIAPGGKELHWTCKSPNGIWFTGSWDSHGKRITSSDAAVSEKIEKVLRTAQKHNSNFKPFANKVVCTLDFPINWGLGSSSTFIALIAKWAQIDAMQLFLSAWQGSGYDVAVAVANSAIEYSIKNRIAKWRNIELEPPDPSEWFFIHSNTKQSTYEEIARFGEKAISQNTIDHIDEINHTILCAPTNVAFANALDEHEKCISSLIELPTIKEKHFPDYPFSIKSLGAWGGDFFLAHIPQPNGRDYFLQKKFTQLFNWIDFIKT